MTRCKKLKIGIRIIVILICVFLLFSYFLSNINPIIKEMSHAKIEAIALKAMNIAISSVINDGVEYDELVNVVRDKDNNILCMQAKTAKINLISRQVASIAYTNIERNGEQGIAVPIGAFTGSPVLAGLGPELKVKIVPVGNVNCNYISEFSSAGINQTLHKMYLDIVATVQIVIPVIKEIQVSTQVLISECVIVGEVPPTYLNSQSIDNMLDLIPSN